MTLGSTCSAWATSVTVAVRSTSAARRSGVPKGISTSTASGRKDTRNRPVHSSPSHPAADSASCPDPGRTPAGILKRTRPRHGSWVSLRAADKRRRDTIPILRMGYDRETWRVSFVVTKEKWDMLIGYCVCQLLIFQHSVFVHFVDDDWLFVFSQNEKNGYF